MLRGTHTLGKICKYAALWSGPVVPRPHNGDCIGRKCYAARTLMPKFATWCCAALGASFASPAWWGLPRKCCAAHVHIMKFATKNLLCCTLGTSCASLDKWSLHRSFARVKMKKIFCKFYAAFFLCHFSPAYQNSQKVCYPSPGSLIMYRLLFVP